MEIWPAPDRRDIARRPLCHGNYAKRLYFLRVSALFKMRALVAGAVYNVTQFIDVHIE
jgi:hypothetical protein